MLFNSFEFLFLFFPVVVSVYFILGSRAKYRSAKLWLVLCSLFFYGWWNIAYLPLFVGSLLVNFGIGRLLIKRQQRRVLLIGIVLNVLNLGYFKYTDFLIECFNITCKTSIPYQQIMLPLAISYFTFQQIAYLVDCYRRETEEYSFLNYALFIAFFPQLLMGPIVHHREMIPQFKNLRNFTLNYENTAQGLVLFAIGMAKKTQIADPLTAFAQESFHHVYSFSTVEAWLAGLSYVFSYYFDLSGYADMALGIGCVFNIKLPLNFNSPYKSRNFAEYWRRWHITLSRFLGNYVYKSLGGSRNIVANIIITFLVSGLWHGAGFNFMVWGLLNGLFVAINHLMKRQGVKLDVLSAWVLTFLGILVTRIFFVSNSLDDAFHVLFTMLDLGKLSLTNITYAVSVYHMQLLLMSLLVCLLFPNSNKLADGFVPGWRWAGYTVALLFLSFWSIDTSSEFLYFQF